METPNLVNWGESRDSFERNVEALITRIWGERPDGSAYVIDGRGGDGGLDIFVEQDGVTIHIYQLKFFPEGMSGGFRPRRGQVKRSFDSVADTPGLREWTLVTPRNPTNSELRATRALGAGRDFTVSMLGRAILDNEIARFPDLLMAATRQPLVDTLRAAGQETAALAGPRDLPNRLAKLSELANSRSLYWGFNCGVKNGVITQTLFAKRPDAAEKEPISIGFTATFKPEQAGLRRELEALLDFGGTGRIELPPEVVGLVKTEGPEWIAEEAVGIGITIGPTSLDKPVPAELRIVSSMGATLASLPGEISLVTQGKKGFTIQAAFLSLRLTVQHSEGEGTRAEFSWKLVGATAAAALSVLRVLRLVRQNQAVEIYANEVRVLRLIGPATRELGEPAIEPYAYALVEDLAVIEREYGVGFSVPPNVTIQDRIDVRVARLLAEGKATTWPRFGALTGTLGSEATEQAIVEVQHPRPVAMAFPAFVVDILGKPIQLGSLGAYHPALRARDASDHIAAIRLGKGEGRVVILEPTDGTPIRIWLNDRWPDPDKRIIPEPWQIDDIPEHPGLTAIAIEDAPGIDSGPSAN